MKNRLGALAMASLFVATSAPALAGSVSAGTPQPACSAGLSLIMPAHAYRCWFGQDRKYHAIHRSDHGSGNEPSSLSSGKGYGDLCRTRNPHQRIRCVR